jgi:hypothetical protein
MLQGCQQLSFLQKGLKHRQVMVLLDSDFPLLEPQILSEVNSPKTAPTKQTLNLVSLSQDCPAPEQAPFGKRQGLPASRAVLSKNGAIGTAFRTHLSALV